VKSRSPYNYETFGLEPITVPFSTTETMDAVRTMIALGFQKCVQHCVYKGDVTALVERLHDVGWSQRIPTRRTVSTMRTAICRTASMFHSSSAQSDRLAHPRSSERGSPVCQWWQAGIEVTQ
jgi:hypothetical protein